MELHNITFPLFKIRSYVNIDKNPLGLVKITTVKNTYILDDTSINKPFPERRMMLRSLYPNKEVYPLKEKILYFRQLVKYKSGTTFVDYNGHIIKYHKSSNLFDIKSYKIEKRVAHGNWTVIHVAGQEIPFLIGQIVPHTTTHASIMFTKWGPLLYDLTSQHHEPYKRKI